MRTRTRTGPLCPNIPMYERGYVGHYGAGIAASTNWSNTEPPALWSVPNNYKSYEDTIEDEVGTDGRYRDCLHTSYSNEFSSPDMWMYTSTASRGNSLLWPVNKSAIDSVRLAGNFTSWDLDVLSREALASMRPKVNEGTSLINFLIELKDLKGIVRGDHSLSGAISRIRGHAPRKRQWGTRRFGRYSPDESRLSYADAAYRLKGGRKAVIKDVLKRLSGAHLETAFGTAPFLRDVGQIFGTLASLEYRIRQLKKFERTVQQRHFRKFLPISDTEIASNVWYPFPAGSGSSVWPGNSLRFDSGNTGSTRGSVLRFCKRRWIQRPVYHATMRYSYVLPELDTMLDKVYLYMDALGVRWDPAILWNAIPYSFVVDWVADVGGFLAEDARDNWPIQTSIHDFCHSVKYHVEYALELSWLSGSGNFSATSTVPYRNLPWWLQPYTGPNGVLTPPVPLRTHTVGVYKGSTVYYKRTRKFADTRTLVSRSLNAKQATLAASLIVNKATGGRMRPRGD